MISLDQAVQYATSNEMVSSFPLTNAQFRELEKLNLFAIHQASNNDEVRAMPVKLIYVVNAELKLALVAILLTCSIMDYHRQGREDAKFLANEVTVTQKRGGEKVFDFGNIRPDLLERFLIPEIVDDWITYRDVNGDGIYALMRKKRGFVGLPDYAKGGDPVHEFARFYRKFMEHKQRKSENLLSHFQKTAVESLANRVVEQKLLAGQSPDSILKSLMDGTATGKDMLFDDEDDLLKLDFTE